MASTELAVTNKEDLIQIGANEPEEDEDNGNWGEDEASKPEYIQLKQPMTDGADEIPNGHFFHKASGQHWAEINMVVLQMHKGRSWKPSAPVFVKGEKVLCRSINRTQQTAFKDGVQKSNFPIRNNTNLVPQATDCAKCKNNSWANYDKTTKTGPKPTCAKDFFFLFLEDTTLLPYIYNATGLGVDPSDAVHDAVKARAKIVKAKTGKMPNTYDFIITMTSEKDGKNYKPKFTTVRQLKPEDAAKFGPLYEQFVKSRESQAAPEPTDPVEGEYVDDTGAVAEDEVVAI